MEAELWFRERCFGMPDGASEIYPPGGYTIHRWAGNTWWATFHHPLRGALGRDLKDVAQLRSFLGGNDNAGAAILPQTHIFPDMLRPI